MINNSYKFVYCLRKNLRTMKKVKQVILLKYRHQVRLRMTLLQRGSAPSPTSDTVGHIVIAAGAGDCIGGGEVGHGASVGGPTSVIPL